MIRIPENFQNNPAVDRKFKDLVEFFNKLQEELEYPNCEGYADQRRALAQAQAELIRRGIL